MVFLESNKTDPYYNLALEEFVFEKLDRSKEYFMLWQNSNAIIVGRYQNTIQEIDQDYVNSHNIAVVRRLSGGGAVYHDMGNLNFTFIVDSRGGLDFDFSLFALPVVDTLRSFGIDAQFTGRNDITIGGRKFSGNSQYIKNGRILHHGCIMLNTDTDAASRALRVSSVKYESRAVKSVRSRMTTISENAETPVSMQDFRQLLTQTVFRCGNMERYTLSDEDIRAVEKLKKEKYETWEWNYGSSPSYNTKKEMRFAGGLLSSYLQVDHGRISSLRFYGDFFGSGDISALESAVEGLALDDDLERALEKLDIDHYIKGLTAKDLVRLLR